MSEKDRDHPLSGASGETGAMVHRARYALPAIVVVAAALTSLRDRGLGFSIGTAGAWAWTLVVAFTAAMHQWDVCSLCDAPPRRVATPEARARMARRLHSQWSRKTGLLLAVGVLLAALLPKPYLTHTWWNRMLEAAVLVAAAGVIISQFLTTALHMPYRDECHVDICRTERRRPLSRVGTALAHYGAWVLLALVPGTAAVGVLAVHREGALREVYLGAVLAVAWLMLLMTYHHDGPCLHCARRLPTNGGALTERRMPLLKLWHRTYMLLGGGALGVWFVSWAFPGALAGRVLAGAAGLLLTAQLLLTRAHGRVQPWCPWCRDDGDEEHSETPDPATNVPAPA